MVSGVSRPLALTDVSDPEGILVSGMLYGFDGTYVTSDSLFPGEGYWLYATNPGQVTFSLVGTYVPPKRSVPVLNLDSFPALHIGVTAGNKTELYFDVKLSDPAEKMYYSLPPLPPQGAFDARFEGDYRIAESNEAVIHIQPSDYPVYITASNLGGKQYALEEQVNGQVVARHILHGGETVRIFNSEVGTLKLSGVYSNIPTEFKLYANYPNPFNTLTTISYDLPEESEVSIVIFDLKGRKIRELTNGRMVGGSHHVVWDGADENNRTVSSGMYVYRLKAKSVENGQVFTQNKKLVLLK